MEIKYPLSKQEINFKGSFYNKKALLKGLEFASDNAAIVTTGTTLALSTLIRPLAILATPNTSKRDKEYSSAKSIASSAVNFGLTAAIFKPVSKAIDTITRKPDQYLKKTTIKNLKGNADTLEKAPAYNFVRQLAKLSPELCSVLPKALLTTILIVPLMNFLFKKDNKVKKQTNSLLLTPNQQTPKAFVSFKGNLADKFFTEKIVKAVDSKNVQNIAIKAQNSNFIQHALNLKDIYATACFAFVTKFNPKIKKEDKRPLIYNAAISTGLTIAGSYIVDKAIQKPVEKFTNNLIKANKNDKKLYKYLNGIKVIKPIVILSTLYYILIPMLSTSWASKLAKSKQNSEHKQ